MTSPQDGAGSSGVVSVPTLVAGPMQSLQCRVGILFGGLGTTAMVAKAGSDVLAGPLPGKFQSPSALHRAVAGGGLAASGLRCAVAEPPRSRTFVHTT